MTKVYVTYDLEESGPAKPEEIYRGAHEVAIDAEQVRCWEVGEFKRAWGRDVYGVRIHYVASRNSPAVVEQEIVEIPANAQNVQVHLGEVPPEYKEGLKSAA